MAISDKDTFQKQKAIRYCLSNNILPFLEVIISNLREVTEINTVITDIDVMGVEISRRGKPRRILFDCKTVNKMSAVNRAFWASGVMSYTGCDESYVILTKKASEAHRLSAKSLNVHLFTESDFDAYAESANIGYLDQLSYSSKICNWHKYLEIFEKNPKLKTAGDFLNSRIPIEQDHCKSLRELLGIARTIKGELDPDKDIHMSVYLTLVMSLMLVFAPISSELSDIYDPDMSIENYEKLLRFYIWGGRESYIQRRDLKNAALEFTGQKKAELELPGWAKFIELSRNLLNAPAEISSTLIPCRELAMRFLSDNDVEIDKHLRARLKTSNRTKQFMTAASDYLVSATGLPKDLHTRLTTAISELT